MTLRDWRKMRSLTLLQVAELLGISHGANPRRRINRIESGEVPIDANLAEDIVTMTSGEVSLLDLHNTRKAWLRGQVSRTDPAEVQSARVGA